MSSEGFEKLTQDALKYTTEGLGLLLDANRLYGGAVSSPIGQQTVELLEVLIEKQKLAVELIQNAIYIEKELMLRQKIAVEKLILKLG